ncbi:major facilitator superfamily domain-containing protein [Pestalotiopsis sp. NC0098]|nr:major facilitator superfamily domain-containing protein [Pestalotiopsis sp. NC0098]
MSTTPTVQVVVKSDEESPLLGDVQSSDGGSENDEENLKPVVLWMVLPILLLGIFLSESISSVVIATNQHIASEFDALSSAAWIMNAYTLSQSASQPLYGKLSDIYGRRKCIIFGWLVFGSGCLLVGVGRTFWHIILGRAISGIGSAGKIALTSIMIADLVPLRNIARYRAYVNLTATISRSIGGPIGGWLAGSVGWRWPFFIQFPVAIIGLALVIWKLPEPRPSNVLESRHHSNKVSALQRIDFAGAFALVAVIVSGLLSVDVATKRGWSWIAAVLVSCFGGSLFAFIAIEKYYAREPIFPLKLLTNKDVLTSYAVIFFQAAGQFGLLYAIPIYFQVAGRESISTSGTRIVPVVIGNAFGTILSGHLITRYKRYKVMTAMGNVVGFVGFLIIFLRWRGSTVWYESIFVALPGMGMGIMQSTTFVHLAASLEQSDIAIAGSSWFLAQNVGILIGSSLSTATINRRTSSLLDSYLDGIEHKAEIIKRVISNTEYIQKLPEAIWRLVANAYIQALLASNVLSMVMISLGFVATMTMRENKL